MLISFFFSNYVMKQFIVSFLILLLASGLLLYICIIKTNKNTIVWKIKHLEP